MKIYATCRRTDDEAIFTKTEVDSMEPATLNDGSSAVDVMLHDGTCHLIAVPLATMTAIVFDPTHSLQGVDHFFATVGWCADEPQNPPTFGSAKIEPEPSSFTGSRSAGLCVQDIKRKIEIFLRVDDVSFVEAVPLSDDAGTISNIVMNTGFTIPTMCEFDDLCRVIMGTANECKELDNGGMPVTVIQVQHA